MPSKRHHFLHYVRYTHLYLGVFIAPALLFFAFTGALQTFSLHETIRGSSYKPPAWIATLAQIHKKQTMTIPARRLPPPTPQAAGPGSDKPGSDKPGSGKSGSGKPDPGRPDFGRPDSGRPDFGKQGRMEQAQPSALLAKPHNPLPLKLFFLLVSIGLFISTLSGLYMSYRYSRNRTVITGLLIAGVVIPIALLYL